MAGVAGWGPGSVKGRSLMAPDFVSLPCLLFSRTECAELYHPKLRGTSKTSLLYPSWPKAKCISEARVGNPGFLEHLLRDGQ